MKPLATIGRLFATTLLLGLFASAAHAQATRTWVSGVGDDANPCSRTAPCKTFAGAISKTAAGGAINVLDPGGFGAVTITKAITIESDGNIGGVLSAGTNGVIVNAGVNDSVVLRGLSIDGANTGINGVRFLAGGKLVVDRCVIQNVTTSGIDFEPSGSSRLTVTNTAIQNAVTNGVLIQAGAAGAANATLDDVRISNSSFGVQVTKGTATLTNSLVDGSGSVGVKAVGSANTSRVMMNGTVVTNGAGTGVNAQGSLASIGLSNSTISNNVQGISASLSGVTTSFSDNKFFNNGTDGTATTTKGNL